MGQVKELTKNDFTNSGQLKNYKNKKVLIKFYTTWCRYCKEAIPEYENLAEEYKNNNNVIIAKIDGDKNEELINTLNNLLYGPKIRGFPTILLFVNNLYDKPFTGERNLESYKTFINLT